MDLPKIAKVLALAASDNEAEALHALRTARRLLAEAGSDFVDLARHLGGDDGVSREALENAVFDLRNEVRHLRCENERLRQGRGIDGAPTSMFEAARAASDVIRLRAELAAAAQALAGERAAQAALRTTLQEMQAELSVAIARLSEAETRRAVQEADNRRLAQANQSLLAQLAERGAANTETGAVPPGDAPPVRKPRGALRAKIGRGQYALF